jgi:replicative DNA helicase
MAIEYSSDVLIGLQYDGMDWDAGESEKQRHTRIRQLTADMIQKAKSGDFQHIQVKVLKNRNGSKGDAYLDFCPMFNYFKDSIFTFEDAEDELLPDNWEEC